MWWTPCAPKLLKAAFSATLAIVLLTVAGCTGSKPKAAAPPPGVVEAKVSAQGPTTIAFGGGHLVIPHGAAPAATTVRISPVAAPALSPALALLFNVRGPGVNVDLGGLQPAVPLTLTFDRQPPRDSTHPPVVLTQRFGAGLEVLAPMTAPPGQLTVAAPHLSAFWDAGLRIGQMASSVTQYFTGARTPTPKCSSAPVRMGDATVLLQPDAAWSFDPAPAHSCLTASPGKAGSVTLDLSPTSAGPWRVTLNGGAFRQYAVSNSSGAVMHQLAQQVAAGADAATLVAAGLSPSYELPIDELPLTLTARSDARWWLVSAGVVAGATLVDAFKLPEADLVKLLAGLADCVSSAADIAGGGLGANPKQAGLLIAAGLSCVGMLVRGPVAAVITIATAGTAFLEAVSTDQLRRFYGRATAHLVVDVVRPAAPVPCSSPAIAADLGKRANDVSLSECHGDWATADLCPASTECVDGNAWLHRTSGRWTRAGALLQDCLSDAVNQGIPQEVAKQFSFIKDCGPPGPLRAGNVLSVDGLGPLRIGMTFQQARKATSSALTEERACVDISGPELWHASGTEQPLPELRANDGRLALVTVGRTAPAWRTTKGTGVGQSLSQVLAAYPTARKLPDYDPPYVQYEVVTGSNALRFTLKDGVVTEVKAGTRAMVDAIEFCG